MGVKHRVDAFRCEDEDSEQWISRTLIEQIPKTSCARVGGKTDFAAIQFREKKVRRVEDGKAA